MTTENNAEVWNSLPAHHREMVLDGLGEVMMREPGLRPATALLWADLPAGLRTRIEATGRSGECAITALLDYADSAADID